MNPSDRLAHRLALLEGVNLSPADVEFIAAEIQDFERIMAALEEFGQTTPWISLQAHPPGKKV